MKTQVSQEAIADLTRSSHRMSAWTLKIFQSLKPVIPLIEDGCEETAMDLALKDLVKRNFFRGKKLDDDTIAAEKITLLSIIRELEHYVNKEMILDAAIAELTEIERKIKRLKKMQKRVRDIFNNLDPRTKALFAIQEELIRLGGWTPVDYGEALNVFTFATIDCLREDPVMAPLIEAYGMACEVNQKLQ